jgi:preprotein translocase subunit SecG
MLELATFMPWIQAVLAVLLVVLVLIQQGEGNLGSAFGGGETGGPNHKKRGFEKTIFTTTIIVACLFVTTAILVLLI